MSIQAERLMVEVQADVRDALRKLDQVERQASTTTTRMAKMAKGMGVAFGGAALVSGATKTIKLAMDFDATMRQVGVQTGRTGKELQGLGKLALKMGKDTVFSAQDASGAMLELAKGGLNAAQIQGGALEETLRLAAAGGLELASAASYVTQGMTTFGLKAKDASQVTVALAGGANASTASVESLGMALSQVGASAVDSGMSIQETVAALAAFDNAGVKGSDAGTALKTMLSRLTPTTTKAAVEMEKYGLKFVKANGEFVSMRQVAARLQKGLGKLSDSERSSALETIFGSDARRAASILMRNGAKGIAKYEKATRDNTKTQEMANSAMEGAKGAWENLKGSAETAAIQVGTKLLPAFTKAAKGGADFISEVSTWGPEAEESFGWIIDGAKDAGKAIKPLADLAVTAGKAWSDLPGPVKEMAVQAGVAALVMPRLTAGVASATGSLTLFSAKLRQTQAEMTYTATRAQNLATVMGKLKGAASAAAGIGGMVLLAQGSKEANASLSVLEKTAGAALLGFSLGGPVGAAIGGVGALATSFDSLQQAWADALGVGDEWREEQEQAKETADRLTKGIQNQKAAIEGLRATMDGWKTSGETAQAALKDTTDQLNTMGISGATLDSTLKTLGISHRTLAAASTGNAKAQKAVADAYAKVPLGAQVINQDQLANAIDHATVSTREAIAAERRRYLVTQDLAALQGKLPKKVVTSIEATGIVPTMRGVAKVARQYNLTPKQIRSVLDVVGVEGSVKQIQALILKAKEADKQRPKPKVDADTRNADAGLKVTGNLLDALDRGVAKPTAGLNYSGFNAGIADITAKLNNLNGKTATTYVYTHYRKSGSGMGQKVTPNDYASGGAVRGPGTGTSDSIPARLSNGEYVMDAETTRRARPLIEALHRTKGRVAGFANGGGVGRGRAVVGGDAVRNMMSGIKGTLRELRNTFKGLDKTIARNMSGKREKAWLAKSNRVEAKLVTKQAKVTALTKSIAKWEEVAANRREAKASFVETTRSGMASQATVLNAGNTAAQIGASLGVQVQKVKDFAGMLTQMKAMGYSSGIISQVAEAGVEGGFQAAKALVAAGSAQVSSMNADFATIQSTASSTATKLGAELHDAGIKAADGVIAGLKSRRKAVQAEMIAMAMAMQKALKKALGIRSPARKMVAPGARTVDGYTLGIRKQTKKTVGRAAAYMASSTIAGSTVPSSAALSGGQRYGMATSFTFVTHNPKDEPVSRTTNKALAKVASLGLV